MNKVHRVRKETLAQWALRENREKGVNKAHKVLKARREKKAMMVERCRFAVLDQILSEMYC